MIIFCVMNFHLGPIEQFVANYIKPQNSFIDRLEGPLLEEVVHQITNEIEKIKINISSSYYAFDDHRSCNHFIGNHQRRIINLINEINIELKDVSITDSKMSILKFLVKLLSELLKYLEREYTQSLDEESYITEALGSEKAREFTRIIRKFDTQFCYSDPLYSIAIEPIHTFFGRDKTEYTYRQLLYLNRLLKEIDQVQRTATHGYKVELRNILIYINFNNNALLDYLTEEILEEVYKKGTIKEQLLKLKYYLKLYRQKQTRNDIAFLPSRRNIKDQIVDWTTEEINYLTSSKKLIRKVNHHIKPNMEPRKFRLNLSVPEIGVLTKIAIDAKIVDTKEITPFVRFLSEHFSSKRQENISDSSLYNKTYLYDVPDPELINKSFYTWLRKMIR